MKKNEDGERGRFVLLIGMYLKWLETKVENKNVEK